MIGPRVTIGCHIQLKRMRSRHPAIWPVVLCLGFVLITGGSASANVDSSLGLDQFATLWTGTIHHVRTDDLSAGGAPGDFQKWDTTVKVTPGGTTVDSTYSSITTFEQTCNGSTHRYTATGSGHYQGPYQDGPDGNGRMRVRVEFADGENRVYFMVPNLLVTDTTNSPCDAFPNTYLYSSSSDHPGGVGFDDEDFGGIGGGQGITAVSINHRLTINQTTYDDSADLTMCGEPSGTGWVDLGPFTRRLGARFPRSTSVEDLSEPFRADIKAFLRSLAKAQRGRRRSVHAPKRPVVPQITNTLRPDERAWLMNTAYRVAGGWQRFRPGKKAPKTARSKANLAAEAPAGVKPYPHGGVEHVPICWLHQDLNGNPDPKASKRAAEQMIGPGGFQINAYGAAYPSNHTKGQAIDMDFSWPTITLRDGDGHRKTIPAGNSSSSHAMWAVGASFGVLKQRLGDPPHWSLHGN